MAFSVFDNGKIQMGIPLSQLTAAISKTVNSSPELFGVWVTAELSDVRITGGHCYMELIEKNDMGQTVAKLRATIWQSNFNSIRRKFFQSTQRDISTGLKVLVKGSINHHSLYGLAFNIQDIDPSYTLGDIERIRREILLKLSKEGILEYNKNRSMPIAPQKIAVISAQGAAGYGDFINQLTNNSEGFVFYPCLFNCVMQGDKVSSSIREALKMIESMADFWDCIAIIRGGGATTDLTGFDDLELARAVAKCGLPIIVGIGHDRDRNVLDDIANTSVKTPTAVAAFFIDRLREAYTAVYSLGEKMRKVTSDIINGETRRLTTIESVMPQLAMRRLDDNFFKLKNISAKIPLLVEGRIGKENTKLNGKWEIISSLTETVIQRNKQKLENLQQLTTVLSPANTLKRGYSITRVNGKALKNAVEVKAGDLITTQLQEGEVSSIITT